jgi:nicotinamide-nucleotide adenylyltransferase
MIKKIAAASQRVKIGIGSAQEHNTGENPLSADERVEMITRALNEAKITNVEITLIPDINNDRKWVSHVKKIVGTFDIVYSGNKLVIELFKKEGILVHIIKEIDPFKAAKIRKLICVGKSIKNNVPEVVMIYLNEISAIERIKNICHN